MANSLDPYYKIVRKPRVTEKGLRNVEHNRAYAFEVASGANKVEIRKAVEALFSVKVESVRTMNMIGKAKRTGRFWGTRPNWKKALVKLKEGFAIEDFY